jgi:hypothetical protein
VTLKRIFIYAVVALAACRETSVSYRTETGGGTGEEEQGGTVDEGAGGVEAGRSNDDSGGQAGGTESGGSSATDGTPSAGSPAGAPSAGVAGSAQGTGGQGGAAGADDGAGGEVTKSGICTDDAVIVPECASNPVGVFPRMALPAAAGVGVSTDDSTSGGFTVFASKAGTQMIAVAWSHVQDLGSWTNWLCFDAIPYPERMAATSLVNAAPEVFVTTGCGELYVRRLIPGVAWSGWTRFGLPSARSFVTDVALAVSAEGVNHVYVADRGSVFLRHRVGFDTYAPFGPWQELGSSDVHVVAAGRRQDGRQMVFMLDANGLPLAQVQRSAEIGAPFDPGFDFDSDDVPKLVDIEATHGTKPLDVLAVDAGGALWLRREEGSDGFTPWSAWPGPTPPEGLEAIAAGGLPSGAGSPLLVSAIGRSGATYRILRVNDIWETWQPHQ